jgi:pantoate--beta-alanine ligase
MRTVVGHADLKTELKGLEAPIGFVPTMGFLHAGHISLVQRARQECRAVVVSIFVNPSQFGPKEDLAAYPRDLPRDLAMLKAAGTDLVWTPTPESMYPPGFQTWVTVEALTCGLEGEQRPGHFRGVATVVTKLFNAVAPQRAYFGQKDAQQAAVIRRMTRDLDLPIEIVICPTLRESDGLAMSSRNSYLSPAERTAASVLYRALSAARDAHTQGEHRAEVLRRIMQETLAGEPLAEPEYVSCADAESLQEVEQVSGKTLLSMAVRIGRTRLIDNINLD